MREFFWRLIAWFVTFPAVTDWLIRRAVRTPYTHIRSADDGGLYMGRWWLFNAYPGNGDERKRWEWLPSIRIHHICAPDRDRHAHDHPWNARTIILRGFYMEQRPGEPWLLTRMAGYTGRLMFGQFHRIAVVPAEGVWTLFITWKKRGTWGFDVDGVKVPYREYLGVNE